MRWDWLGILLWAVSHLFLTFGCDFGNGLWGLLEIVVFGLLGVVALRIVCEALLVFFKANEMTTKRVNSLALFSFAARRGERSDQRHCRGRPGTTTRRRRITPGPNRPRTPGSAGRGAIHQPAPEVSSGRRSARRQRPRMYLESSPNLGGHCRDKYHGGLARSFSLTLQAPGPAKTM